LKKYFLPLTFSLEGNAEADTTVEDIRLVVAVFDASEAICDVAAWTTAVSDVRSECRTAVELDRKSSAHVVMVPAAVVSNSEIVVGVAQSSTNNEAHVVRNTESLLDPDLVIPSFSKKVVVRLEGKINNSE
jgi:hypothetical protein